MHQQPSMKCTRDIAKARSGVDIQISFAGKEKGNARVKHCEGGNGVSLEVTHSVDNRPAEEWSNKNNQSEKIDSVEEPL